MDPQHEALWNGDEGAGGISWVERSQMGPLRGVIDAADHSGRRNLYMHTLHRRVLQSELNRIARRGNFLDFGCGTGRFIPTLSSRCKTLAAVDREPAMLEAAQAYAARPNVHFERCESIALRFPAGHFDFVLCSSVLCVAMKEHFEPIIRELARVTRTDGKILFLEQVSDPRGLSLRTYTETLARSGFHIERAYPIRSKRSFFTSLVARKSWIPRSLFETMASIEIALTPLLVGNTDVSYVEYAVVARRVIDQQASAH
jgi:ubiquinone/menaquinone biosynthesis C-methylase UbiE